MKKTLQVAIIKITESKESKSSHRLDVSGSTSPYCGPVELIYDIIKCRHDSVGSWNGFIWGNYPLVPSSYGSD